MTVATVSIQGIHFLVIAFFVTGPYLSLDANLRVNHPWLQRLGFEEGVSPIDLLYVASGVGLILHWLMNSDICVLTQIEALFRGKKAEESFLKRLIRPIYIITDDKLKKLSYFVVLGNILYIIFYKYRAQTVTEHGTDNFN